MMIPFPYDIVGAWTAKHNIELTKEAYEELVELFIMYTNNEQGT